MADNCFFFSSFFAVFITCLAAWHCIDSQSCTTSPDGSDCGNQPSASLHPSLQTARLVPAGSSRSAGRSAGTDVDGDPGRQVCGHGQQQHVPCVPRRPCHVMQESTHFQGSRPGPVHLPLTSRSAPGPKTGDRAESVSKPFVLGVSNGPLEAHPRRAHFVYQRLLLRSYLDCTSEQSRDGPPQAHHHLSISQSISEEADDRVQCQTDQSCEHRGRAAPTLASHLRCPASTQQPKIVNFFSHPCRLDLPRPSTLACSRPRALANHPRVSG